MKYFLILSLLLLLAGCRSEKSDINRNERSRAHMSYLGEFDTPNTSVIHTYELTMDGREYIVVKAATGISICPKVDQ